MPTSGANGAGKTTLVRALAGQLMITAATITFGGVDVGRVRTAGRVRRGSRLVPQGHHLFAGLSVLESLKMGAYPRRSRSDLGPSLEMVFDLVPVLRERTSQPVASLSGGERAMLAVVRGLMSGARPLLLDEPSLGLAPKVRTVMFETLARISACG